MRDEKSKYTINHEEIRHWAEERDGRPAVVIGADVFSDPDALKIIFPTDKHVEGLEKLSWTEFYIIFDKSNLAFLFEEANTRGHLSHAYQFVSRFDLERQAAEAGELSRVER